LAGRPHRGSAVVARKHQLDSAVEIVEDSRIGIEKIDGKLSG
jgi:hypothetical protein